jgi:exonuclease SbcC
MVPIRLHLRNFLSYGENVEPLDFTGMHVACLSGNNGHGKSALLDAMTWALWGEARTSSADDLVRLGQSSMQVEFEFAFDGHEYRVIRKRTRGRSGQSDLQFQVRSSDRTFRPLTEQGIRETQRRITQTLRMDYETFIHSSFLLQGRADEFARKGPMERKKILAEILGLSLYDELMERARARAREADSRREAAVAALRPLESELAQEEVYRASRAEAALTAAQAEAGLKSAEAEQAQWRARKSALETVRARRDDLVKHLAAARAQIETFQRSKAEAEQRVTRHRALLDRRAEIEDGIASLAATRRDLEDLSERAAAIRRLGEEREELRSRLQAARASIEQDLVLVRRDLCDLVARQEQLPELEEQALRLTEQDQALRRSEEELHAQQETLQAARVREAQLGQIVAQLEQALAEEKERFEYLKGAEGRCPVCEADLSPEKRHELGCKVRRQRDDTQRRLDEAQGEQKRLAETLKTLQREVNERARVLKNGQGMRERLAQAEQMLHQCREALLGLPRVQQLVAAKEALLRDDAFAAEERERLAALDARIAELDYSETARKLLQARVRELEGFQEQQAALQAAEAQLAADESHVTGLATLIAEREATIAADVAQQADLERELSVLPEVEAALARADAAFSEASAAHNKVERELAVWEAKLADCARCAVEAAARREERGAAEKDRANFEELARIFGRNGIQALIIENAIPEIENEANLLLARLSDNNMRVAFRTQRDLKNQSVAETLDIDIADELGTRKLECFSGGESFRVHFAIRIALSKLLTRRAGAPLQTLIIDEGFGSQDSQGRDRLVEAIHAVQDEFEKILVITHIDELKDAFPTRIEVTKTHLGSQIAVV